VATSNSDCLWRIRRNVDQLSIIPTLYTTAFTVTIPGHVSFDQGLHCSIYITSGWNSLPAYTSADLLSVICTSRRYCASLRWSITPYTYIYSISQSDSSYATRDYSPSEHSWWDQISEKAKSASHHAPYHFYLRQYIALLDSLGKTSKDSERARN